MSVDATTLWATNVIAGAPTQFPHLAAGCSSVPGDLHDDEPGAPA